MLDEYKRVELDNGLCVIGVENPALHYFSCHARVHAGPRFEPRDHVGLTHMLEHMIIQGSEKYPTSRDIMRSIEDLGGVLDASTHPESLDVYVGLHRKHWEKGLDIFTDVLLNPLFDRAEIEQEKNILIQEISNHRDERGRNISASEMAYSLLFLEEPDELGSRGSVENIRSFDQDMVRDYFDRFFVPENMVISLAGSYDFDEIVGQLNDTLGQKKNEGCPPKVLSGDVERKRARAVYRETERTPVVEVDLSHRGYGLGHEKFGAMTSASHILGGGLSSRLFTQVREEKGLVYRINSQPVVYSDTGAVDVLFSVERNNLVAATEAVMEVIAEFREEGIIEDELESYKENARCGMDIMCDRPDRLANYLGRQELLLPEEEVKPPGQFVEEQEKLTPEDLSGVIEDIFTPENANLSVVGPFEERDKKGITEMFPSEEVKPEKGA